MVMKTKCNPIQKCLLSRMPFYRLQRTQILKVAQDSVVESYILKQRWILLADQNRLLYSSTDWTRTAIWSPPEQVVLNFCLLSKLPVPMYRNKCVIKLRNTSGCSSTCGVNLTWKVIPLPKQSRWYVSHHLSRHPERDRTHAATALQNALHCILTVSFIFSNPSKSTLL